MVSYVFLETFLIITNDFVNYSKSSYLVIYSIILIGKKKKNFPKFFSNLSKLDI